MTSPIARAIDATATCARCSLTRRECQCPSLAPFDIVLPLPPNMANGRMHWRTKDRKRKAYLRECDSWSLLPETPVPPRTPHAFVELRALLILWSPMDDDGAMARIKWPLDWLVTRGYLAGDSRKHVRWLGVPEQEINRKVYGTVIFRITPRIHTPVREAAT